MIGINGHLCDKFLKSYETDIQNKFRMIKKFYKLNKMVEKGEVNIAKYYNYF